jgi:hypothetical protein
MRWRFYPDQLLALVIQCLFLLDFKTTYYYEPGSIALIRLYPERNDSGSHSSSAVILLNYF